MNINAKRSFFISESKGKQKQIQVSEYYNEVIKLRKAQSFTIFKANTKEHINQDD